MPRKISACFRNLNEDDWRTLQSIRKNHGVTWCDFVHQLATYSELTEQALKLPPEIDNCMTVDVNTLHNLLPSWMDNTRENFDAIKNGLNIRDIPRAHSSAIIIGAGPSLYRHNHLQLLSESTVADCLVFVVDRVLKDCLDAGIVPDYVLFLDGSDKVLQYIDHDAIDDHIDEIDAIMCITTHPSVVKRWKGKIHWFSNSIDGDIAPNISYLLHLLTRTTEMTTAGHVTSLGWSVAYTIGCREIVLIGTDLSYTIDTPMEETWYYDRYKKAHNGDIDKIKKHYKTYHHTFFGTDCYFDPVFESYIDSSMIHFQAAEASGCKIINCTEGGAIEGRGVVCMRFAEWLDNRNV